MSRQEIIRQELATWEGQITLLSHAGCTSIELPLDRVEEARYWKEYTEYNYDKPIRYLVLAIEPDPHWGEFTRDGWTVI